MEVVYVEPARVEGHAVIGGSGSEEGRIDGVIVRPLTLYPDDRGHFTEIFRDSDPIASGFTVRQSSLTRTRAGVIKAFHYHLLQDDIFCPLIGTARIALIDFRPASPTYKRANSIFAGELYPKAVRIPAGVAHGYEVFSGEDLLMVYYTNQTYNPNDEYRLSYDDPAIGFDQWGVKNR